MHILFAQAEVWSDQKDCRARPSTDSTTAFNKEGHRVRPSLPTLPGMTSNGEGCPGQTVGVASVLMLDPGRTVGWQVS